MAAALRNRANRWFLSGITAGLALLVLCLPAPCAASQVEAGTNPAGRQASAGPPEAKRVCSFELRNYANLPELFADLSRDAGRFFRDFYSQTPVTVYPFVFLTESGEKRFSPMGATLADQMIAMINDQQGSVVVSGPAKQQLKGVLMELDGYLRVHMSGINAFNQRRSYTAEVEMSEALYRSLYVDSF